MVELAVASFSVRVVPAVAFDGTDCVSYFLCQRRYPVIVVGARCEGVDSGPVSEYGACFRRNEGGKTVGTPTSGAPTVWSSWLWVLAGESLDGLQGLVGVAFHVAGVIDDVADDALGIDDVGDAADHAAFFVPRAERFGGLMIGIPADEPVAQAAMLRKRGLGWNQINA